MKLSLQVAISSTILALFATANVQAEELNFTGLSLAIGADYTHTNVDYGGFLAGKKGSDSDAGLKLDASYGFAVASKCILTVGANYEPTNSSAGTINYFAAGKNNTLTVKETDRYSLYVAPGYLVDPSWLVYGKVSWQHAKSEFVDTLPDQGTTHHDGFGWGAGVDYAYTHNIEVRAELQQINLSRESYSLSNGKPDTTEATVYVGYRFN